MSGFSSLSPSIKGYIGSYSLPAHPHLVSNLTKQRLNSASEKLREAAPQFLINLVHPAPFLMGKLPFSADSIAKGMQSIRDLFILFRHEMSQLRPEEQAAVLRQFPEELKPMLNANWQMSAGMELVSSTADVLVGISDVLKCCVNDWVAIIAPPARDALQRMIPAQILQQIEQITQIWKRVVAHAYDAVISAKTIAYIYPTLVQYGQPVVSDIANWLASDVRILDEVLDNTDQFLSRFPPAKAVGMLLNALSEFSQILLQGQQRYQLASRSQRRSSIASMLSVSNKQPIPSVNGLTASTEALACLEAAGKNALPAPEINSLFRHLFASSQLPNNCLDLLNQATSSFEISESWRKEYALFCEDHHFTEISADCLQVVEKAFYVKKAFESRATVPADALLLANIVLLNPERSLINTQEAIQAALKECSISDAFKRDIHEQHHTEQEADAVLLREFASHQLANASPTMTKASKDKLEAYLILANAAKDHIFTTKNITDNVCVLYIKQYLYPNLIAVLFPPDFAHLLSGLSKLVKLDLDDLLSTFLAEAITANGLQLLTDSYSLSTSILHLLGANIVPLAEYSLKEGDLKEVTERFGQLCQSMNAPEYANALNGLAFARTGGKSRQELAREACQELETNMNRYASSLKFPLNLLLGTTFRNLGKDIPKLTARQDWGLFLLILAGKFNHALQHPDSFPDFDINDPTANQGLQMISKGLLPSVRWLLPLAARSKKAKQTASRAAVPYLNYSTFIPSVRLALKLNTLAGLLLNALKFHAPQSFPDFVNENEVQIGISEAIKEHVYNMLHIVWGLLPTGPNADLYAERYVEFLLQQKPTSLLSTLQIATSTPENIRQRFMQEQKAALQVAIAKAKELLIPPIGLCPETELENRLAGIQQERAAIESEMKAGDSRSRQQINRLNASQAKILKIKEFYALNKEIKALQTGLSLMLQSSLDQTVLVDIQSAEQRIEELQEYLAEVNDIYQTKLRHREEMNSADKEGIGLLNEDIKNTQVLIDNVTQVLQGKKMVLRNLEDKFQILVTPFQSKRDAIIQEFIQDPLHTQLRTAKQEFFQLLTDASSSDRIEQLKDTIKSLEEKIQLKKKELEEETINLYQQFGLLSPFMTEITDLMELMINKTKLETTGQADSATLSSINQEIRSRYLRQLQLSFAAGLKGPDFTPQLFSERQAIQDGKQALQEISRKRHFELAHTYRNEVEKIESLREELEQLADSEQTLDQRISITNDLLNKLAVAEKALDAKRTLESNEKEMAKFNLAIRDKTQELAAYNNSQGVLKKIGNLFLGNRYLAKLQAQIQEMENEWQMLAIQNALIQEDAERLSASLKELENHFHHTDLESIRQTLTEQAGLELNEKERLQTRHTDARFEFNNLQSVKFKYDNEQQQITDPVDHNMHQLTQQEQEIDRQLSCAKFLNTLRT